MTQQRSLHSSDSPAGEFITAGHAADASTPDAGKQEGSGNERASGMALQFQRGKRTAVRLPVKTNIYKVHRVIYYL